MGVKISILIPVYNTSKFLPKCLNSIINQTYRNIEVIIVNDGSTDNSAQIIDSYASLDSRIIIVNQVNMGLQGARRTGIKYSSGDYIMFIDSDDSLPNSFVVQNMINGIGDNVDIVVGRINIDDGHKLQLFASDIFTKISANDYLRSYLLCGRVGWNLWGKLFKAQLVKSTNGSPINVSAGEDALYVLSMAYLSGGSVVMVNNPVYNYYLRSNSITNSGNVKYISENFQVADYIDKLMSTKIEKKYIVAFRLLCMSNSFRYGWLGRKHPLNANTIRLYNETKGVLSLFRPVKALQILFLLFMGDFLSKYYFKNYINDVSQSQNN